MGNTKKIKDPKSTKLVRSIDLRIEYSDLVKIASGTDGILFSFCQTTPHGDEVVITNDILLPVRVASALHSLLGAQLNAIEKKSSEDKGK